MNCEVIPGDSRVYLLKPSLHIVIKHAYDNVSKKILKLSAC